MTLHQFVQERLIAERAAIGADRYDEVWDGVYVMNPMPNNEHQELAFELAAILREAVGGREFAQVFAGVNLSDREVGWTHNYRVPDVAVFLKETQAKNCGTHWCGAADFLIEIVSPDDRSREKIEFYESIGVRELLLVDRDPWKLELYQGIGGRMQLAGASLLEQPSILASGVVPLTFQLVAGEKRPRIQVFHAASGKSWLA